MDNFESSRIRSSIDTSSDPLDPLAYVIRPSPTETPAERLVRVLHEAEAKAISDTIDEELEKQAIAERKELKPVKILLLGKSSTYLLIGHNIHPLQGKASQVCCFLTHRVVRSLYGSQENQQR